MRGSPVAEEVRALALVVEDAEHGRRWWVGDGECRWNDGIVLHDVKQISPSPFIASMLEFCTHETVAGRSGAPERGVPDGGKARRVLVRGRLRYDIMDLAVRSEDIVEFLHVPERRVEVAAARSIIGEVHGSVEEGGAHWRLASRPRSSVKARDLTS